VLAKGLNFVVALTDIPVSDFVVAAEQASWNLSFEETEQLKNDITGLSKQPNLQSPTSQKEHKVIKELKKRNDVVILPVNKGKARHGTRQAEYVEKINKMLSDIRKTQQLNINGN